MDDSENILTLAEQKQCLELLDSILILFDLVENRAGYSSVDEALKLIARKHREGKMDRITLGLSVRLEAKGYLDVNPQHMKEFPGFYGRRQ